MLTPEEISSIRKHIEDEYAKDIQALERLSRFIPKGTANQSSGDFNQKPVLSLVDDSQLREDPNAIALESGSRSILSSLADVMSLNRNRTWTGQQLKAELERSGYKLNSQKPMATIAVALKKLLDRDSISLVRRGSGREPHIYRWKVIPIENCVDEGEPEAA